MLWIGLITMALAGAGTDSAVDPGVAEDEIAEPHVRVEPTHRAFPGYVGGAGELGFDEISCYARFELNEQGEPTTIAIRGCFDLFADQWAHKLQSWRWPPGTPTQETTLIFKPSNVRPFNGSVIQIVSLTRWPDATATGERVQLPGISALLNAQAGRVQAPLIPDSYLDEFVSRIKKEFSEEADRIVTEVLGPRPHEPTVAQERRDCSIRFRVSETGKTSDVTSPTCPSSLMRPVVRGLQRGRVRAWAPTPPGIYRLPIQLSAVRGPTGDLAYLRIIAPSDRFDSSVHR